MGGSVAGRVGVGPAEPALCRQVRWEETCRVEGQRGGGAVGEFEDVHRSRVTGSLAMFDRMIFKGHLSRLYKQDGARSSCGPRVWR